MNQSAADPLHELHAQAEAEFQNYGDVEIVSTFGEPQAEYSAIRKGCALIDLPQRGILEVLGADRLDFLNRFLTNELIYKETKKPLAAGEGRYAFLLNNKGRIIADMNVLERGDRTLLETDARHIPLLRSTLEKFIFSEKVTFETSGDARRQIVFHGPRSVEILQEILGNFEALKPLGSASVRLFDVEAIVWRDDPCGVPSYGLILPADQSKRVWIEILSRFSSVDLANIQQSKRRVWATGWAAFNATRIEAGRALFGIDFDDTVLPAETGQIDRAVSFVKGCYLGQEIVARMHARGQVARQIVGIKMSDDSLPMAGAPIVDDAQSQIGVVTSSTVSPILSNASICLAMLKKQFIAVGTSVKIAAEGSFRTGVVTELPFVKNSAE